MSDRPTILAAVDDSAAARPVIGMAVALGPLLGSQVEVLRVGATNGEAARSAAASYGVPFRGATGDPFEELVRATEADDVVALVIGARRMPAGSRPVGHLTLALAGAIEKPILVVPPDANPPERLHTALLAVEGSPGKARSLRRTVELAAATGLDLVVVHVDDEESIPSFSDQVQYETEEYVHEFLARHVHGAPRARLEVRIGVPAEEILAVADTLHPELIAVGWPHTTDPTRGAVARQVLARSRIPVLLVGVN